jgi:hypothetical protein
VIRSSSTTTSTSSSTNCSNFLSLFDSAIDSHSKTSPTNRPYAGGYDGRPNDDSSSDSGYSSGSPRSSHESTADQPIYRPTFSAKPAKPANSGANTIIRGAVVKGPWTAAEDERLTQLVQEFGPKKWKGKAVCMLLLQHAFAHSITSFHSNCSTFAQSYSKAVPRAMVPPFVSWHQQSAVDR